MVINIWLVVGPTPLKNDGVSASIGMMKFPTEWKVIKFHGSKPPSSKTTIDITTISITKIRVRNAPT